MHNRKDSKVILEGQLCSQPALIPVNFSEWIDLLMPTVAPIQCSVRTG